MKKIYRAVLLLLPAFAAFTACNNEEDEIDEITFEELELADSLDGVWNGNTGADPSNTGFNTGNARFTTYWENTEYGEYWEGFAYTNHTDNTTTGIANQYSSIAGGGEGGAGKYAVFFMGFYGNDTIFFRRPERLDRMSVSNTAYAALAMKNGDSFTKKFGGTDGEDPDWFSLIIEGFTSSGQPTGIIEVALANFREAGSANDYISEVWTTIPVESLGTVQKLALSFASSDTAFGFINVPTYVCIDNIVGVLK